MIEVVKQRPMNILHPYMIEIYVAKNGSEACISLATSDAYCARNGAVKRIKLLCPSGCSPLVFGRGLYVVQKKRLLYSAGNWLRRKNFSCFGWFR
jgi:hypothetical protein